MYFFSCFYWPYAESAKLPERLLFLFFRQCEELAPEP
jgi:hypothetical protein